MRRPRVTYRPSRAAGGDAPVEVIVSSRAVPGPSRYAGPLALCRAPGALPDGRFAPARPAAAAVSVGATARGPEPAQTLDRAAVGGHGPPVHVASVAVRSRPAGSAAAVGRPHFLRLGYGVDVLLPGRQRLLQRQLPRTVRLLFAQTVRAAAAAAVRAAQAAGRRRVGRVRETPQEYAAVGARAHHRPAVRAHLHVGHDARVTHPDVRRHPFVVQPYLHHLIRTAGHDVFSCKTTDFTYSYWLGIFVVWL